MPEKKKTHSIILRRMAFGDADWIVHFFSRELGRMGGIAKNARSSIKRFGGALEPGTVSELSFTEKHGASLVNIIEARVLRPLSSLTRTLERICAMQRAMELALAFLKEHQPAPEKYDLLISRLLEIGNGGESASSAFFFELKWLALSGFGPRLQGCVICGKNSASYFDYEQGGTICETCGAVPGLRIYMDESVSQVLRNFCEGNPILENDARQAAGLIQGYIEYILGHPLKTHLP